MSAGVTPSTRPPGEGYTRGFWALIGTQFQGAFNDNLYRFLIVFYMTALYGTAGAEGDPFTKKITALATILFAVPYLLFPGIAGALSDRFSKRSVTIWTKVWEVFVMVFAIGAFYAGSSWLIFLLLYLMFMQSAFFSPSKYGIVPELLPEHRLSWGNGILAMTTFVAIIAGQVIAGLLWEAVEAETMTIAIASCSLVLFSVLGLLTSFGVTRVPAAAPGRRIPVNPWAGMGKYFGVLYRDPLLWLTLIGGSYFWFVGAMAQQIVISHGRNILEVSATMTSVLAASVMVGIGAGSLFAGYYSRGRIEWGLVPLGLAGMALASFMLAAPFFGYATTLVFLFVLGFFGGLFEVPLMAGLQHRPPADMKGGVIAAFNIATCAGVLIGGGVVMAAGFLNINNYVLFAFGGFCSLAMGIYMVTKMPRILFRTLMWLASNTMYRVKSVGRENLPPTGGALLIGNHMSIIDIAVIAFAVDRPVRFFVPPAMAELKWARRLKNALLLEPVHDESSALAAATEAVERGELVCVFAGGKITADDGVVECRDMFETLMPVIQGREAPVIPLHLDRLWNVLYKDRDAGFYWVMPRWMPYRITVSFGAPMAVGDSGLKVRESILLLGTESYTNLNMPCGLLNRMFVRRARRTPFKVLMADMKTPRLSYFKGLVGSLMLARKFKKVLGDAKMVGLLVPPSVGGALTNAALQFMGKVPVNLNYTASAEALRSAVDQCNIRQVLTSREFLAKFPLEVPGEAIYLEDIRTTVTKLDQIVAMFWALFFPAKLMERFLGAPRSRSKHDLATIIFSSGSEAAPKGVMLSHFNILSNIEAGLQVFPQEPGDFLVGILPFFHSFGFMGTLWIPLASHLPVIYYPNPLDAKNIGPLVKKYQARILISTPTFLQNFIRRCLADELSSLNFVVTGAEKLPARVREAFKRKFGVEAMEGYGTTECAPGVSISRPDYQCHGYFHYGVKHGCIGSQLPGMCVEVRDPDTEEPLPEGDAGLLWYKGPNIMMGYLGMPEKTARVLKDGWYNTGDVGKLDRDGFVTITDRLARFSKIAGEMVPHMKIEDTLHQLLNLTHQTFAVTTVPDAQKGERLVVLHTLADGELEALLDRLKGSDLPNLWRPKSGAFYRVEEIPVTATGKMDLRKVKGIAQELDVGE